jgi:hypothetical protein
MMVNSRTGFKVAIISAIFLAGSAIPAAQADHNSHSILPYIAVGIFASMLNEHSHSHRYTYKKKRHYGHSNHRHGGHRKGHYSSRYKHQHNHGGYRYRHNKH